MEDFEFLNENFSINGINESLYQSTEYWIANATETSYTPYEERLETYIVPTVFALIFIVGVLGNGTLIVVFLRHRAMRNVPNT